jgi:hypothetical protein
VKAFQRLWNRNNANDKITADGIWGPQTEGRMKKAPAAGFPIGAQCSGSQKAHAPEDEAEQEQMRGAEDTVLSVPDEFEHEPEEESCADHAL